MAVKKTEKRSRDAAEEALPGTKTRDDGGYDSVILEGWKGSRRQCYTLEEGLGLP